MATVGGTSIVTVRVCSRSANSEKTRRAVRAGSSPAQHTKTAWRLRCRAAGVQASRYRTSNSRFTAVCGPDIPQCVQAVPRHGKALAKDETGSDRNGDADAASGLAAVAGLLLGDVEWTDPFACLQGVVVEQV